MAHPAVNRVIKIIRRPSFWLIVAVMVLITLPHYKEAIQHPVFLTSFLDDIGLTRHAFERIFYLAPIVWAGFLFGWKGALVTSLFALGAMLPRAIFISEHPTDALFETGVVFVIGNVLAISFASLRRERDYRTRLENTQRELKVSEERFRKLFEDAHDAIWLHDLDGKLINANRATATITGYSQDELLKMNVKSFLSEDSLALAQQIGRSLLAGEPVAQPYEQRIFRRDGSQAVVQLATSLMMDKDRPVAFQNIARDISEQKRMEENQRFYLQQATLAQEEERKRISHELHDDTIQSLVVLSRQLDALATGNQDLTSEDSRRSLEELWQQTNNILQGVRRLSQDLRPAAIDRLGLLPALEWLAAEVTRFSGVDATVSVVGQEHRLPETTAIALFRITQEALRNVWRHSGAQKAEITIAFTDKSTRVTIRDDGQGFKLPDKMGDLAKHGKLGLAGMQERAQLVGGTLKATSRKGKGTTIVIEAPG